MSRKRVVVGLVAAGLISAAAAPALAEDRGTHVCVVATHDRTNPGPSVICVVVPVDKSGLH